MTGIVHPKIEFYHHLLTLMSFQTRITDFLLWNIKYILKKHVNQTVYKQQKKNISPHIYWFNYCSIEERNHTGLFGITREWVNDDRIYVWVTVLLIPISVSATTAVTVVTGTLYVPKGNNTVFFPASFLCQAGEECCGSESGGLRRFVCGGSAGWGGCSSGWSWQWSVFPGRCRALSRSECRSVAGGSVSSVHSGLQITREPPARRGSASQHCTSLPGGATSAGTWCWGERFLGLMIVLLGVLNYCCLYIGLKTINLKWMKMLAKLTMKNPVCFVLKLWVITYSFCSILSVCMHVHICMCVACMLAC